MKFYLKTLLFFSIIILLGGCDEATMRALSTQYDKYPQTDRLVRSGDTIYQALGNSGIADFTRPVRKARPWEGDFPTYNPRDNPSRYPGATQYVGPPTALPPGSIVGGSGNRLVRSGNVIYQRLPNGDPDLSRPWHTLQPGEVPDPTIPVVN